VIGLAAKAVPGCPNERADLSFQTKIIARLGGSIKRVRHTVTPIVPWELSDRCCALIITGTFMRAGREVCLRQESSPARREYPAELTNIST
jgi:hypothetical protein